MAKRASTWTEGFSATSAGRFGAWAEQNYEHKINGLLGCSAGVNELYAGTHREYRLGRYEPGEPFYAETEADWVCVRHTMKTPAGKTLATVYQSLLSPGVLFEVKGREFTWFNDRTCQILQLHVPGAKGVRNHLSSYTLEEPMSEPWLLGVAEAHGRGQLFPLLFVFQHRPVQMYNCNSDLHRFKFAGPTGRVVVMPLLGPARITRKAGGELFQGSDELFERCRWWAKSLLAYPYACQEHFRVDHKRGRVDIRNRFRYRGGANDFGWEPRHLAPASPVIAAAGERGFDVDFEPKLIDTGLKTFLGPYCAAEGKSLRYSLPKSPELDRTICPVRIENDRKAAGVTKKLAAYLEEPDLTFGGDDTYEPTNIQDVLHDMRVLAWASWSVDDQSRRKFARRMLGCLRAFDKSNYRRWTEGRTGEHFLAEKLIWHAARGDVTYDYEWYNGMQLAGLWAGMHWLGREEVAGVARTHWLLVKDIAHYFAMTNDWATATFWTDFPGEFMHFDGWHFGWQGLIGLYRVAREIGRDDQADWAAYAASKSVVPRWASWLMNDYVAEATEAGLSAAGRGGPHDRHTSKSLNTRIIGGFVEAERFALSTAWSPGNALGYFVPEQYQLYRTEPRIRRRVEQAELEQMPKADPDWAKRPTVWGYGKGPFPYPSHWHFYQLDDHYFVRSMVLRRPMDELLQIGRSLSGPVMASILLAGAPMVVAPTAAEFGGVVYDAREKMLTIRLSSSQRKLVEVAWPDEPAAVEGATIDAFDRAAGRLLLSAEAGDEAIVVHY